MTKSLAVTLNFINFINGLSQEKVTKWYIILLNCENKTCVFLRYLQPFSVLSFSRSSAFFPRKGYLQTKEQLIGKRTSPFHLHYYSSSKLS